MACDLMVAGTDSDDSFVSGVAIGFLHLTESLPISLCAEHKKDWHRAYSNLLHTWKACQAALNPIPEVNTVVRVVKGGAN